MTSDSTSSLAPKRVAIFISGRGSNMDALIAASQQPGFPATIALVLSNKPEAAGLARAQAAGIATAVVAHSGHDTRESFDAALEQQLIDHTIDIVCLAGFLRLLTDAFVTRWHGRMINIHPSLLPSFKGLHSHQHALDAGVKFTGCTVHFVTPDMDAGPIISQAVVPIQDNDTSETLAARVLEQEHQLYPKALEWLASDRLTINGQNVSVFGASWSKGSLQNPETA